MAHRDDYLVLDDLSLLARCEVRTFQGSGPGGQHRNKTNTGVELLLPEFNLEIRCCEDRSAGVNRNLALRRLRLRLAEKIRSSPADSPFGPFPGSGGHIHSGNPQYARW
ncbi:MAG TPA: peptide chain release factor-like protein, partial [Fibrobacteraceae bacterium]|nr:peptide chain release factor-like protein [Fibrobacteraceae bacterium]